MNAEIIQKRLQRLVKKVQLMRHYQGRYLQYRARDDLDKAKRYQREVDSMITEEVKIQQTKDQFNGEES